MTKDENTGLYYYGARYYDPRISLWHGVDPLAEDYPGWSTFAYTMNNPITYWDPTGMNTEDGGENPVVEITDKNGQRKFQPRNQEPLKSKVGPAVPYIKPVVNPGGTGGGGGSSGGSTSSTLGQRVLGVIGFILTPANGYIGSTQTSPLNITNMQRFTSDPSTLSDEYLAGVRQRLANGMGRPEDYLYADEARRRLQDNNSYNSFPKYENPGQHDPNGGGRNRYNPKKSVLPSNHEELWNASVLGSDGNRWTIVSARAYRVYHRFQDDGNGNWHWNESTNGRTFTGEKREISINNVPIDIKRKY